MVVFGWWFLVGGWDGVVWWGVVERKFVMCGGRLVFVCCGWLCVRELWGCVVGGGCVWVGLG